MTSSLEPGVGSPRVLVQFLEGGAASAAMRPDAAATCLREAVARLPIDDLCLGWNLPLPIVDAVAGEAERHGLGLWLWHPLLSGDGRYVPGPERAQGATGRFVEAPTGEPEFSFDCPVRREGLAAALERLDTAASRYPYRGVLLDKIRWPSPTRDPSRDLVCFCDVCRDAAGAEGLDLSAVADWLTRGGATADGRLRIVRGILQGGEDDDLDAFLAWRCDQILGTVRSAAQCIAGHHAADGTPMRVALDVFSPLLARAVGQDIAALARHADFVKGMLYLGTHGPAGLPYELASLLDWLDAGGVSSPAAKLAGVLGLRPADLTEVRSGSLGAAVFQDQLQALRLLAGATAAAGIDAVVMEDLAVLPDATLETAIRLALDARTPIVLSWDLLAIPPARLSRIAHLVETVA